MRQGEIHTNGVLSGLLHERDNGEYIFRYDDFFSLDESQSSISLSFPKSQREFISNELFSFFYHMLYEGTNTAIQCQTLKIDENEAFGLLVATSHTDTSGTITITKI